MIEQLKPTYPIVDKLAFYIENNYLCKNNRLRTTYNENSIS